MNLQQNPRTLLPKFFGLYTYQVFAHCKLYTAHFTLHTRQSTLHTQSNFLSHIPGRRNIGSHPSMLAKQLWFCPSIFAVLTVPSSILMQNYSSLILIVVVRTWWLLVVVGFSNWEICGPNFWWCWWISQIIWSWCNVVEGSWDCLARI